MNRILYPVAFIVCGFLVAYVIFMQYPIDTKQELKTHNVQLVNEPSDELKEVMHLTSLLRKIEEGVNQIYDEYDVITLQYNSEIPANTDEKLLSNINNFQTILEKNKLDLNNLKKELNGLKSSNKDVKKIKANFLKLVEEKNIQIENLVKKTLVLESEIKERDIIIEETKQIISQQTETINLQNTKLESLNQKQVVIYSRKATKHFVLKGNKISIPEKVKYVELISDHIEGSYTLKLTEKQSSELTIKNETAFWNESNYVIIKVRKL